MAESRQCSRGFSPCHRGSRGAGLIAFIFALFMGGGFGGRLSTADVVAVLAGAGVVDLAVSAVAAAVGVEVGAVVVADSAAAAHQAGGETRELSRTWRHAGHNVGIAPRL